MASNIPVPPVTAAGTAPATGIHPSLIPAPAANATPLLPISPRSPSAPHRPVTALEDSKDATTAALVLQDGTSFQGFSFGSEKASISGECVFQTGNYHWLILIRHKELKPLHYFRHGGLS